MYRPTAVRNQVLYPPIETVAENDRRLAEVEAKKVQLDKTDKEYDKKVKDFDIQIQALKDNRTWAQQAENSAAIKKDVMGREDFEEVVEAAEKEYKQFTSRRHTVKETEQRGDTWNSSEPYTGQAMRVSIGIVGGFGTYYSTSTDHYYTAEEKAVMNYLHYKGDEETLKKYQDSLDHIVNERRTLSDQLFVQNTYRGDNELEKAGLTFGTFGEILNSVYALGEAGVNAITGQPTDPYSRFQQMAARPQFIRNESLKYVPEGGLRFLAETGYSGGDTIVAMLCGPAAPYIMASEAGGQMANSITQRGGSSGEAFLGGAATAIIEYLTERISIGKLFDTAETAGKFFTKETFVNMLQNAGVNMSEEWTAEVFETLSDYAIMGDRSEIGMRMAGLIESGMSPGEAMNQAFNEFLVYKPLEAAASGALQGFLLSGGASAVGRLMNTQHRPQQGRQDVQDTEATEGIRGNPDIDNKEGIGDNRLSDEENSKLNQWKYRPNNDLYLKYKTTFDNPNYFDQKTGEAIYPGLRGDKNTNGFADGKSGSDTMKAGSVYKRYGSNGNAQYFTDASTPYEQLSLPPGSDSKPLLEITVLKDIPCSSGDIAAWFGQPGGGKQYFTDIFIEDDLGNMHKATMENLKKYGYISIKVIK